MTVTDRASTPPSTGATPVVPVPPVLTPDHPAEREDTGVTLRRAFAAGASLTVLVLLVAIIAGSVSLARLSRGPGGAARRDRGRPCARTRASRSRC